MVHTVPILCIQEPVPRRRCTVTVGASHGPGDTNVVLSSLAEGLTTHALIHLRALRCRSWEMPL